MKKIKILARFLLLTLLIMNSPILKTNMVSAASTAATIKNATTGRSYTDFQLALDEVANGQKLVLGAGDLHPGTISVNNQYVTTETTKRYLLKDKSNITIVGAGLSNTTITNLTVEGGSGVTVKNVKLNEGFSINIRRGTSTPHSALETTNTNNFTLANSSVDRIALNGGSNYLLARNYIGGYSYVLNATVDSIKLYNNTINAALEYANNSPGRPLYTYGGFSIKTPTVDKTEIKNNLIYSGSTWTSSNGNWVEATESLNLEVNVSAGSTNIQGNVFADFDKNLLGDGYIPNWTLAQEKASNSFVNDVQITDIVNKGKVISGYTSQDFVPVQGGTPDIGAAEALLAENFENGMNSWEMYTATNASSYTSIQAEGTNNKALSTDVWNTGVNTYDIHTRKGNLNIKSGTTYTVTFKARTEAGKTRSLRVLIEEDALDYTNYGSKIFQIDGTLRTYSYTFTSTNTDPYAAICIEMGKFGTEAPLDVIIDDVTVTN